MKSFIACALAFSIIGGAAMAQKNEAPKSKKDKISYSIGLNMGKDFKARDVQLNVDMLARGIKDALSGAKPALSDKEMEAVMTAFQQEMMGKMEEQRKVVGEKNKKAGEAFLAANKTKEGVVTLPSGLQYKILTAGTGAKPSATSTVKCNYRGTLIDGTEFDSSYKRGEPAEFPLNQVIKGWTEALQLMSVGSKWQLVIPSDLAYGQNAPPQIGPDATLIFEVELLSITK